MKIPVKPKILDNTRLVGRWTTDGSAYVIDPDGWFFNIDGPRGFMLSSGDMILTLAGENPVAPFSRTFGSGPNLIGVWVRTIVDSGTTYVEEITFRVDGSMSSYWTEDGLFQSNQSGRYTVSGSVLTREERFALIMTSSPDQITFEKPFDTDQSGTYVVATDLNSWTFTSGGKDFKYTRIF
jgi:hypothetical protein